MIDPTRHRQLQELDVVGLCTRILQNSRNELYLNMRYLDLSLSSLGFEMDPACRGLGTDGFVIYYHGEYLCESGISSHGTPLSVLSYGYHGQAGWQDVESGL